MGTIGVLPDDQIESLLHTAIVGRLACCDHRRERPYLVPLAFGYDGRALYAHTGPGTKLQLMHANPLVTVEVDEVAAADNWRSVVAEGEFQEITDPFERLRALRAIYPEPATIPELGAQTVVFRILLTAKSGRFETP